ncbi:hypothetical protein Nepgr_003183 [Nepenthes gracilis]|uniref:Uncharacterized protein n=1 Tax=Nepenthes gracilis TaxID=150966 RepID=A0AAD3RZ06_NEPGR|nr:hypothetical protein Nepgr_003183 [Nepenthes gracilis]
MHGPRPQAISSLRSQNYFSNKTKSPAGDYILKPPATTGSVPTPSSTAYALALAIASSMRLVLIIPEAISSKPFYSPSTSKFQEPAVQAGEPYREWAVDSKEGGGEQHILPVGEGAHVSVLQRSKLLRGRRGHSELEDSECIAALGGGVRDGGDDRHGVSRRGAGFN